MRLKGLKRRLNLNRSRSLKNPRKKSSRNKNLKRCPRQKLR